MNSIGFKSKDTLLNVGVRGNAAPLMWVKGVAMADPDHDGIYTTTIDFDLSGEQQVIFKYVLNEVEWEGGDIRSVTLNTSAAQTVSHIFRYVKRPENPFRKFIGEWTLKDDLWEQGDGKQPNERIKIPGHHTLCQALNTDNSLLWIVDATSGRGHIMWVYNGEQKQLDWVSSFFPARTGVGKGSVSSSGDIEVAVTFEGEPENTYRKYSYTWVNENEYVLKSFQYNTSNEPTGNFYGGTFVRVKPTSQNHQKSK
jgi:hypothetical protein